MNIIDLDLEILKFFNRPFSVYLNIFFLLAIYSVYPTLLLIGYHLFRNKKRKRLFHLITASVIGVLLVLALKYAIARPRPYSAGIGVVKIFEKTDPSFPSAHTFIAFLCFYFLPKNLPKWLVYFSAIYLLILIPIGSMYIGVHYPSDIIAGAIIGIAVPKIISEKRANRIVDLFSKQIL